MSTTDAAEQATALFCGIQADGRTWVHSLTIDQVESWDGPAIVVAECPEHPHTPAPHLLDATDTDY